MKYNCDSFGNFQEIIMLFNRKKFHKMQYEHKSLVFNMIKYLLQYIFKSTYEFPRKFYRVAPTHNQ